MAAPATLVLVWSATLVVFIALALASSTALPLPGDVRTTHGFQQIAAQPPLAQALDLAALVGGQTGVAVIALPLAAALIVRGMRLEAAALAGAFAMRLLQLALRDGLEWPHTAAATDATFIVPGGGFPSGHVLGQVLVFGLLFAWAPRITGTSGRAHVVRAACVALIVLGAAERVAVGAHWPSEVVGGALLAALYLLPAVVLTSGRPIARAARVAGAQRSATASRQRPATSATAPQA